MNWQEVVITVISAIVTALASWVVSKITTYINTKVKDTKLKGYLNSAVTVVASAVKQTYIQTNFGDLDEWIITQIEAAIYDLKNKSSEVTNASA